MSDEESFRGRVTRQSEETIGKLAQELIENPVVSGALSRAFETRERAMKAQEAALGALNLPSAGDLERLTRRVRSVSQRLEGIEDGLDRLEERLARAGSTPSLDERLAKIEAALERLQKTVARPPAAAAKRTRSKSTAKPARAKPARAKPARAKPARAKPARSKPAAN